MGGVAEGGGGGPESQEGLEGVENWPQVGRDMGGGGDERGLAGRGGGGGGKKAGETGEVGGGGERR